VTYTVTFDVYANSKIFQCIATDFSIKEKKTVCKQYRSVSSRWFSRPASSINLRIKCNIPFTLFSTLANVLKFIPEFGAVLIHTHSFGITPISFNANVVHWTARYDAWRVCPSHPKENPKKEFLHTAAMIFSVNWIAIARWTSSYLDWHDRWSCPNPKVYFI
jgi:hypothetical protein